MALGAYIHPLTLAEFFAWLPVTLAMLISTPIIGALGYLYFSRIAGFDRTTAFFAGMPGGVYEMTYQGGMAGGDERRIALAQAVRIFIVVFTVPFVFNLFFHFGSTSGLVVKETVLFSVSGALVLLAVGIGGWFIASLAKLPNPPLLGPLLGSALFHFMGWSEMAPPYVLVAAAQVVLGTSVGGQFIGADKRLFASAAWHGLFIVPMMLVIAAMMAFLASAFTDTDYAVILLALAPGGTAELSIVALAIHMEVAIVVTHQMFRIIMIYTCVTRAFSWIGRTPPQ